MTILGVTASSILKISGAFQSIASATGTGSSGTITFSSIPSTYRHLQIRCLMRDTTASAGFDDLWIRFNGDTSTNYKPHYLQGNGSGVFAGTATGNTFINSQAIVMRDSNSANMMSVGIIDVHDYASTSKNKTVRMFQGGNTNGGAGGQQIYVNSGLWIDTTAISSISLITGNNNWTTTTQFALYGITGS